MTLDFTKQFSLKKFAHSQLKERQLNKCTTFVPNLILIFWPCIWQSARGVWGIPRVGDHPQHSFPGLLRGKETFHDGHHPVAPICPRDVDWSPVEQKQNNWYPLCWDQEDQHLIRVWKFWKFRLVFDSHSDEVKRKYYGTCRRFCAMKLPKTK